MLQEQIEDKWIETFASVFEYCKVESGTVVAILSETQSRPINVPLLHLILNYFWKPIQSQNTTLVCHSCESMNLFPDQVEDKHFR